MPSPPFLYPVPRLTHPTYPPPAALRLRHRYRPIGQVISTAPVAAVAPATAVTPGLRLANLSIISFIFTIMVPLYIWPRVASSRRKCDV